MTDQPEPGDTSDLTTASADRVAGVGVATQGSALRRPPPISARFVAGFALLWAAGLGLLWWPLLILRLLRRSRDLRKPSLVALVLVFGLAMSLLSALLQGTEPSRLAAGAYNSAVWLGIVMLLCTRDAAASRPARSGWAWWCWPGCRAWPWWPPAW